MNYSSDGKTACRLFITAMEILPKIDTIKDLDVMYLARLKKLTLCKSEQVFVLFSIRLMEVLIFLIVLVFGKAASINFRFDYVEKPAKLR